MPRYSFAKDVNVTEASCLCTVDGCFRFSCIDSTAKRQVDEESGSADVPVGILFHRFEEGYVHSLMDGLKPCVGLSTEAGRLSHFMPLERTFLGLADT